jgi:hypothetical protein
MEDVVSIYHDAIKHYGEEHQLIKCAEELNELSAAIIGYVIRKQEGGSPDPHRIMCEKADVEITMKQLGMIFASWANVCDKERRFKLARLAERIQQDREKINTKTKEKTCQED